MGNHAGPKPSLHEKGGEQWSLLRFKGRATASKRANAGAFSAFSKLNSVYSPIIVPAN